MHKYKSKLVSDKIFADQLNKENSTELLSKSNHKIVSKKEDIIKQNNREYAISEIQKELVAKTNEEYTPDDSYKTETHEIHDSIRKENIKEYQTKEIQKELVARTDEKYALDISDDSYKTETHEIRDSIRKENIKEYQTKEIQKELIAKTNEEYTPNISDDSYKTKTHEIHDSIKKESINEFVVDETKKLKLVNADTKIKESEKKKFQRVEKNYLVKEEYIRKYQIDSIEKRTEKKAKLLNGPEKDVYGITKSEELPETSDTLSETIKNTKIGYIDGKILYRASAERNSLPNTAQIVEKNGINNDTTIKGIHRSGSNKKDNIIKEEERKSVAKIHKTEKKKHDSVYQTNGSKSSCKKEKKNNSSTGKSKGLLRFAKNYAITTILNSDKNNEDDKEIKTGGKNMLFAASHLVGKGISKLFIAIMGGSTVAIITLLVLVFLILFMAISGTSSSSTIGVSNSVLGSLISDESQLAEFKSNSNYIGNILGQKFTQYTLTLEQWTAKSFTQTVITGYNPDGTPIQHTEEVKYTVNFVNHGVEIDNSADIFSLYLSIINDETNYANITAEGEDQTNMPYLIADTPKEIDLLNTLFSQMNYTIECDKELQVYQLTGDQWIAQYGLTEDQKKYYEIIKPNINNLLVGMNAMDAINVPNIEYNSERAKQMMSVANSCLGIPYVWGGSSPATGMDCSGFACWVYNQCGYNVGRTTAQGLYNVSNNFTDLNQAQPGDLVFYGTSNNVHHVAIYAGDGMIIEAPHSGAVIRYSSVQRSDLCGFGRL